MSDSTSGQPASAPPAYTDDDLRRWLAHYQRPDGQLAMPSSMLRAVLTDLLAYREAEAAANAYYRRPDGIEDVAWMQPYTDYIATLDELTSSQRARLVGILDEIYVRACENAAAEAGQSALLATELRRLMPAGSSTLDAVRSAVDRLDRVREAMLRDGGRLTDPAAILALEGAHEELRAMLVGPKPAESACTCPDGPSLLCPVPRHRADAAMLEFPERSDG